jgi:hypothetical protein
MKIKIQIWKNFLIDYYMEEKKNVKSIKGTLLLNLNEENIKKKILNKENKNTKFFIRFESDSLIKEKLIYEAIVQKRINQEYPIFNVEINRLYIPGILWNQEINRNSYESIFIRKNFENYILKKINGSIKRKILNLRIYKEDNLYGLNLHLSKCSNVYRMGKINNAWFLFKIKKKINNINYKIENKITKIYQNVFTRIYDYGYLTNKENKYIIENKKNEYIIKKKKISCVLTEEWLMNLEEFVKKYKPNKELKIEIIKKLIQKIELLHKDFKILHRDINVQNIVILEGTEDNYDIIIEKNNIKEYYILKYNNFIYSTLLDFKYKLVFKNQSKKEIMKYISLEKEKRKNQRKNLRNIKLYFNKNNIIVPKNQTTNTKNKYLGETIRYIYDITYDLIQILNIYNNFNSNNSNKFLYLQNILKSLNDNIYQELIGNTKLENLKNIKGIDITPENIYSIMIEYL